MGTSEDNVIDMEISRLLIKHGANIDEYMSDEFNDRLVEASQFKDAIIEAFFGEKKLAGYRAPWAKLHEHFRFRAGELTIWSGPSGEGKSLLTSQCALAFVEQGATVVIASLEMHPAETLARACCQFHGYDRSLMRIDMVNEFLNAMEQRLWLYDEVGDIEPQRAIALAKYARAELGADHLIIDSLVKCGIDDGDYKAEKRFVSSLQNIAKKSGLHIHLVTHKRKGGVPGEPMHKEDVSGTAKLTDLADNVLLVSRNRKKTEDDTTDSPDTFLRIAKQRHGTGWEGTAALWFTMGQRFMQNKSC